MAGHDWTPLSPMTAMRVPLASPPSAVDGTGVGFGAEAVVVEVGAAIVDMVTGRGVTSPALAVSRTPSRGAGGEKSSSLS